MAILKDLQAQNKALLARIEAMEEAAKEKVKETTVEAGLYNGYPCVTISVPGAKPVSMGFGKALKVIEHQELVQATIEQWNKDHPKKGK